MGFGFSLGGSKSKGKSSTTQSIDKELKPLRTEVLGQSMTLARSPIRQYQGERVAGFNPMQQQAFGSLGALANQGQGLAQRGFNILGGIGTADQRIGAYMNPFTSEVIDRSMSDLERQRQMTMQKTNADAINARAFGGSRQAVADSLTNEAYARQMGDLASQLRYQGFNTALGAAQQDVAQQQGLAQALQSAGYGALEGGLNAGSMQQQLEQARLDSAREQFYEPENLQMQRLDFLTGILSGLPQGGKTTGKTSGSSMNFGFSGSAQ